MNTARKDGKRKPVAARPSINTSVIPIWDDPNNHCRSCSKTYAGEAVKLTLKPSTVTLLNK